MPGSSIGRILAAPRHVRQTSYDRRVKVLVVGSGGREHALVWSLARGGGAIELHAAPGNPGIAELAICHPIRAGDTASLAPLASELGADLVVVGPEAPLVAGLADELRHRGLAVFGPSAAAARIEASKAFAKEVLDAAEVPTAGRLAVARPPCVLKADGLAAGKGVWVCHTRAELEEGLRAAEALGQPFHVEELLEGEEVSLFALCDGTTALTLPAAQDYKRIGDGDEGPNTGGMGSYSPVPRLSEDEVADLVELVHVPVLQELARRRSPFTGALFAGLMLTEDGPRVLEFNCRFGDPETQSLLPRLEGDLLAALAASAAGELRGVELPVSEQAAVTVVLAAREYPERGDSGTPIEGIAEAEETGALVFQAGTALHDGRLVTNGGRILNVTALGDSIAAARATAYDAAARIDFAGVRFRRDIAHV
jgi:phosphoribosylamine---glycine ligase